MRRYILFAAIACGMIFSACNRPHDTQLEEALEMAGENRTELEKPIQRYSYHIMTLWIPCLRP